MFNRLINFAVIVEQQSLNRASKLLNVSQPALSRQLHTLENEIGLPLFKREGKRLSLTSTGQLLYQYALEERQLERKFQQEFAKFNLAQKREFTIGASLTTLQSTLPDLITHFTRTEPETEIIAVTGKTHEIIGLVKSRKVDVGLVASMIEDPTLRSIPLFDDHLSLIVPRKHPLTMKASLQLEDVNGLPMILFSRGTWYRILTDEWFERYRVKPAIKMEIDSFEAILRLVSTGHNAALLPKSYLRQSLLEDNALVRLDLAELQQTIRTTSLVTLDDPEINPAAQRFVTRSRHYFNQS
jgi:LysR family transcriptional regulator, transcriptional activator of the cysJI operon